MELYDTMRTTFAARDYTGDAVSDAVLYKILENARFAPSGGNRQGNRVIVVRDKVKRKQMAARHEGFGGTITTLAAAVESEIQSMFNIPTDFAVAAVLPLGRPVKQLTKLKRLPVEEMVTREQFDGEPFTIG